MGPVGGYQVNVVMVLSPVVPNKNRQFASLASVVKPIRAQGRPAATQSISALRHDTPSALTGDLTNRTGHDLQLGIDPYPWFSQCSPTGGSAISVPRTNNYLSKAR